MTTFALLAVVLLPVLSALVIALLPDRHDDGKRLGSLSIVFTLLTLLAMVYVAATADGSTVTVPVMRLSFWAGGFQKLYGLVVCFMWFVSALLSPQYFHGHHHLKRYYFFFLICLSFTLGVFLSADLKTTFLFFELMSLSSYVWVVQEETPDAMDAGKTYLTIAVLGGLVTLMGLAAKNAILIVEFAKIQVDEGADPVAAAIHAAQLRFRPILMTSLAFVLGMLPMVIASGPGSASRHSIGTGVFFGMIFAITVGIVLVPFFFVMVYKLKERLRLPELRFPKMRLPHIHVSFREKRKKR